MFSLLFGSHDGAINKHCSYFLQNKICLFLHMFLKVLISRKILYKPIEFGNVYILHNASNEKLKKDKYIYKTMEIGKHGRTCGILHPIYKT